MAGCAMIGQSVINVTSGGRGRLSCLVAGVVLLVLVVYGSELVRQIPMAALVAVMIMFLRCHAADRGGHRGHPRPGKGGAQRRAAVGAVLRPQGGPHAGRAA
ncbi:hypothetical protein G6F32_016396 [Rhizopus arrhizus]|nr:hypothetical protein G6F32_016396 [Rhizopus arrhizus]